MRIARIGPPGAESPIAAGDDGHWHDISSRVADVTPATLADLEGLRAELPDLPVVPEPQRFGPPVAGIGKVVCIGLNYRDHAAESGASVPTEPVLFMKAADTVVGPDDDVLVPRGSTKTDYEVELAVVIGRPARYLNSPADAAGTFSGMTCASAPTIEPAIRLIVEVRALTDAGSSGLTKVPFGRRSLTGRKQPPFVGIVGWLTPEPPSTPRPVNPTARS